MSNSKIRSSIQTQVITLLEALAQGPDPQSRRFAEILRHGNLSVERYSPHETNGARQREDDAAYMIVQGSGVFVCGDKRVKFEAGDFLFTPGGTPTRFERLSDDLVVWMISYGSRS